MSASPGRFALANKFPYKYFDPQANGNDKCLLCDKVVSKEPSRSFTSEAKLALHLNAFETPDSEGT